MIPVVTMQLLSGQAIAASFETPRIAAAWAALTEWALHVAPPTGTPTTASIRPRFQVYQPNTVSLAEEGLTGAWFDVSKASNPEMFPGDDWPTLVADHTLTAATLTVRSIVTTLRHRLAVTVAFTGGTAPAWPVSIRTTSRG